MCGTPEYLAPEMIQRLGHSKVCEKRAHACCMLRVVAMTTCCHETAASIRMARLIAVQQALSAATQLLACPGGGLLEPGHPAVRDAGGQPALQGSACRALATWGVPVSGGYPGDLSAFPGGQPGHPPACVGTCAVAFSSVNGSAFQAILPVIWTGKVVAWPSQEDESLLTGWMQTTGLV